jgi:hypothetical protein
VLVNQVGCYGINLGRISSSIRGQNQQWENQSCLIVPWQSQTYKKEKQTIVFTTSSLVCNACYRIIRKVKLQLIPRKSASGTLVQNEQPTVFLLKFDRY